MLVGKLTESQKEKLMGEMVQPSWKFNPFLSYGSIPAEWVISLEEIVNSSNSKNEWVKTLPLTEFVPKPVESENYFNQFFSGTSQN